MIDLRLPNITAATEQGKLEQMRSYLYQMAEQLNFALKTVETQTEAVATKVAAATKPKNTAEQAQATFSEIKSLIIKSADIVNAYTEQITAQLEGRYVAQSEFGTYQQAVAAQFTATAENVDILFTNTQQLTADVGQLNDGISATQAEIGNVQSGVNSSLAEVQGDVAQVGQQVQSVAQSVGEVAGDVDALAGNVGAVEAEVDGLAANAQVTRQELDSINGVLQTGDEATTIIGADAWVKIGVLQYDDNGYPVYGMEIGQVNTAGDTVVYRRFAQYRSDGVHLYDQNGIEVATISDTKLRITNAEVNDLDVKNKMAIGGYKLSTTNGLAFKWGGTDA